MPNIVVIELKSFDDLVYFVHSRLTTVSIAASILCDESRCFTIIGGDDQYFVVKAPAPSTQAKFAYVDEQGAVRLSNAPPVGRPAILIVRASRISYVQKFEEALG